MNYEQKAKLDNLATQYISIGVTENGDERSSISVPWDKTSNAFNMKTPTLYIEKSDINDVVLMERLKKYNVIGFYIFCPLDRYDFLGDFKDIRDLYIRNGDNIKNLDFLKTINCCRMLFIENAVLPDLKLIIDAKLNKIDSIFDHPFNCVGLCDCKIEDLSDIDSNQLYFSEFIVWNPVSRNEKDRWIKHKKRSFTYYEFDG